MKFSILAIFKRTVPWHLVHSYCCATITRIYLQSSFHFVKLKLYQLNYNFLPSFSSPWTPPFYFMSLWIRLLWVPPTSGIMQCLPFESGLFHLVYIHLPIDGHWVASTFWLLWVVTLWTWVYKYFESLFLILLDIYPEMELLDHMVFHF